MLARTGGNTVLQINSPELLELSTESQAEILLFDLS
jgi:hypothetical protein